MFLADLIGTDPLIELLGWEQLEGISFLGVVVRLLLALLCGGILGYERTKRHQPAGFRTYIIVCLGATIAMYTNEFLMVQTQSTDTARLGAQVISGIGFLGAGAILITSRNRIRGLTTAAGLWASACLGLAIGSGFFTLAIFSTILMGVVLAILPHIEKKVTKKLYYMELHIEFAKRENLKEFVNFMRQEGFTIIGIEHNPAYVSSGLSVYSIGIRSKDRKARDHLQVLKMISDLSYVNYVEEIY